MNVSAPEEYGGTIEAYTYPKELAEYDGSVELYDGLSVNLQRRKPFGLSYQTRIGNDTEGIEYGYKIHIIYNVLVAPSSKNFTSIGSSIDPLNFSWPFTTTPIFIRSDLRPSSHIILDSTKVSVALMRAVEGYLYGSETRAAKLIPMETLIYWFESGGEPFELVANTTTGLYSVIQDGAHRDLVSTDVDGAFAMAPDTRLTAASLPGTYTLET
jgi:hypothetical protein